VVVVTGAGMSTACGIKDYRSGVDTCLPTGPVSETDSELPVHRRAEATAAQTNYSQPHLYDHCSYLRNV